MQHKMSHIKLFFILLFGGIVFSSCSQDQDLINPNSTEGLGVGLQIGKPYEALQRGVTTTPSDDALKEDVIKDLNLFFYDADSKLVKHYYLNAALASGQRTPLEQGENWRTTFPAGTTYTVYAIANMNADLGDVTLADLPRTISDNNIYLPYNASTNADKRFVMDGKTTWTSPAATTYEAEVPVDLKRAASKVIVNFSFTSDMQTKMTPTAGATKWGLKRYATTAQMLQETTPTEFGLTDGTCNSDFGTVNPAGTNTFIAYVFPNDWTADPVANQTLVQLDIPCTYKVDDATSVTYDHNVYTLPITEGDAVGRNQIYVVNATLGKPSDHSVIHVDLKYNVDVYNWATGDEIPVGENTKAEYLYVIPQKVTMKNVATDNSVTYISSGDVTVSVEQTPENGTYYNNTNGVPTSVGTTILGQITATLSSNLRQGTITLNSPIPTNLGPRYIRIKITNGTETKYVDYVQYPLEYITGISGGYSYKDDGDGKQIMNTYDPMGNKGNGEWLTVTEGTWEDNSRIFDSRWYHNGKLYTHYGNNPYSNPDATHFNNQMYNVRITTTSSEYIIDKPQITDGITEGSYDNNQVVSPAFMLASQLGIVSATSWQNASDHCKQYVEVHTEMVNGNEQRTTYNDWRLPTLAELAIISKFQNNGGDVMTTVLAGSYYWSAYHVGNNYGYYGTGKKGGSVGKFYDGDRYTTNFIRCIRDIKPSEIKE